MSINKEKKSIVLKSLIYIAGIFSLYAFISVRSQSVFNFGVNEKVIDGYWDNTKYGELYYFNYISHFKEDNLPQVGKKFQFSSDQATLNNADILIFGDSFFDMCRPTQFPIEFAKRTNKKIHFEYYSYPLEFLKRNHYQDSTPKIILVESVERLIPERYLHKQTENYKIDNRSEIRKAFSNIIDMTFVSRSEEFYDMLLRRFYLTSDAYSFIATAKFDLFKYISRLTPVYSLDDTVPWLFFDAEVNGDISSFYYDHSNEELELISNNILDLSQQLKDKYNMELIFIPIPAKYTLYHNRINNDSYSNFLPKLHKKLEEKGVRYINIYDSFKNSNDLLYMPTDGHWNEEGLNLAVDITLDSLRRNGFIQ